MIDHHHSPVALPVEMSGRMTKRDLMKSDLVASDEEALGRSCPVSELALLCYLFVSMWIIGGLVEV